MNKFNVVLGDITKLKVEAIVNAANESLLGGGGVDGAIHRAAGPELFKECLTLKGCETGKAKITKGYKLPAKWIIHTVGPVYSYFGSDANKKDKLIKKLASCYEASLDLALENDIHSIAFPSISTGYYGFPHDIACEVATSAVEDWLKKHEKYDISVTFCCYDNLTFSLYNKKVSNIM